METGQKFAEIFPRTQRLHIETGGWSKHWLGLSLPHEEARICS